MLFGDQISARLRLILQSKDDRYLVLNLILKPQESVLRRGAKPFYLRRNERSCQSHSLYGAWSTLTGSPTQERTAKLVAPW